MINDTDRRHLERCVELARMALEHGDQPFGSVLVAETGEVLAEERNHVGGGDHTNHPEFALARWSVAHLTPEQRSRATVYTSGEHCPMCAAAHGWVGLGRIVYASSASQLAAWLTEFKAPPSRVKNLPIDEVIRDTLVEGPVADLAEKVRELQRAFHLNRRSPANL